MAFKISMTKEAESQWRSLSAREQSLLETAVQSRLVQQPTTQTNAIKKLRPNPLAQYELRAGNLRILYNVEGAEVILLIVGRKVGNKLIVQGTEYHGHQNNPSEQPGGERPRDAE